jgi:type III secretory pathway component EscR
MLVRLLKVNSNSPTNVNNTPLSDATKFTDFLQTRVEKLNTHIFRALLKIKAQHAQSVSTSLVLAFKQFSLAEHNSAFCIGQKPGEN